MIDCDSVCYTSYMGTDPANKIAEELGKKLRKARERKELTQEEVAKMSGVSVNYYARIERGEVNSSVEKIRKIIVALGIKSSEILPF